MVSQRFRDPWRRSGQLRQNDFSLLQRQHPPGGFASSIRLNSYGNVDALILTAQLPGWDPSCLELEIEGNSLTLAGTLAAKIDAAARPRLRERPTAAFRQRIELPYAPDPAQVSAHYEHGILTLMLPRPERDKPRKIPLTPRPIVQT